MLKSRLVKILSVLLLFGVTFLQAQEYPSIFGIQPYSIRSRETYLSFKVNSPQYMKIRNPLTGEMIDMPENTILNEAALHLFAEYGITDNLNTYINIPFLFVHHYSLNLNTKANGFGDIEWGGIYNFWRSSSGLSALSGRIAVIFPTGQNKNLNAGEYALGSGAWQFQPQIDGIFPIGTFSFSYSAFYRYRGTDNNQTELGDLGGAYLLLQKKFNTQYGNFQSESGFAVIKQSENEKNSAQINYSDNFQIQLLLGFTYKFKNDLLFRIGLPYTIYQNQGWSTNYSIQLQLDKLFGINN